MINRNKQAGNNKPTFGGRLLIISILFFIPSAILVYFNLFIQSGLFVETQIGGYIFFAVFAFIYIVVIKAITWIFSRMGINIR
jgi:hypothetical protein